MRRVGRLRVGCVRCVDGVDCVRLCSFEGFEDGDRGYVLMARS